VKDRTGADHMKFGHIGIKVTDIERSKKFYTEVLDCKIIKDYKYPKSNLVFLDAHGTIIELIYKKGNTDRSIGPVEHIAFKVESLDEKMAMLKEKGVEIQGAPRVVGSARIVFFDGPDNERFEFVERYNG